MHYCCTQVTCVCYSGYTPRVRLPDDVPDVEVRSYLQSEVLSLVRWLDLGLLTYTQTYCVSYTLCVVDHVHALVLRTVWSAGTTGSTAAKVTGYV